MNPDPTSGLAPDPTTGPGSQPRPFEGLKVIVTGTVEGLSRDAAVAGIEALGGTPVGSISARTDLVVLGEGAGLSKTAKARTHNTPVIDAETFAGLVADPDTWDGQPLGEPIRDWEARNDPDPEPDPAATVPFEQRHLVGKAVVYTPGREVRMWCLTCTHTWLGEDIHAAHTCPNDPALASLDAPAAATAGATAGVGPTA